MIATVTHARLRASQGDLAEARRILAEVLRSDPGHDEARELLEQFSGRRDTPVERAREAPLVPPEPARATDLADSFRKTLAGAPAPPGSRAERLREWLEKISGRPA